MLRSELYQQRRDRMSQPLLGSNSPQLAAVSIGIVTVGQPYPGP